MLWNEILSFFKGTLALKRASSSPSSHADYMAVATDLKTKQQKNSSNDVKLESFIHFKTPNSQVEYAAVLSFWPIRLHVFFNHSLLRWCCFLWEMDNVFTMCG